MPHTLAMQTVDEDEVTVPEGERVWCLVYPTAGEPAFLCQKGFIMHGATCGENVTKSIERGGITCPNCLRIIRDIKAIKL